ncbi:helix-turn-helix transcriptional regulator [bacterium]|nr:helix-turn-helix transcriptional regulator [bacterium]MDB2429654.1 helix-turn-helix transcriptional regulator [Akkermansiaceae bacterium]MDB4726566.1 helix-turn-helix transcriptional regulator [bacterium]MDB4735248.1 helix-turn-helix transcriptional regulator [Akkermansiaceae bacterium]
MADKKDSPSALKNIRNLGKRTTAKVVRANEEDHRDWLQEAPLCPLLSTHQIIHAGIMKAYSPFEIVRTDQSGTFMLACIEGEGAILVDGSWKKVTAGKACLLPPFVANALKCVGKKPWVFCWVRYLESKEITPIVSSISPVLGEYDGEPLQRSIEGLLAECRDEESVGLKHHWVELIHQYVLRFAQPHQSDDRLWKLWQKIDQRLDYPWSLAELGQLACVSGEHLRRLCKKALGRSPMQQLTFLRMQKASQLLLETDEKIETIARMTGYKNAFHFSNVFMEWVGIRPSEFRG